MENVAKPIQKNGKKLTLIGNFIRSKRETLNLSQKALGQLLDPPVTTQFISNVERGVTPLPPAHVPTLAKALSVNPDEIMVVLEREYALRLSDRLGQERPVSGSSHMIVAHDDLRFLQAIYEAYRHSDGEKKQAFRTVCESVLGIRF